MSPTTECAHCGRRLDVDEQTLDAAEKYAGGDVACSGCEGMHELLGDLPPCDFHDCDELAPFSIEMAAGPIHRCRAHLIEDLQRGWHTFHSQPEVADACQFPGCGNAASATYCEACQKRVKRATRPPSVDPLPLMLGIVITVVAIAATTISMLMYWRVI